MGLLRQVWILAHSDLRQEMRDLELLATAAFFTLVVAVMLGLSFAALGEASHRLVVPGFVWLCVAFVGSLTLNRVFDREREADTLRALLVAPVERLAIYLAKAAVTAVIVLGCAVLLVPVLGLLFPAAEAFGARPGATLALLFAGVAGYALVGTLFAAGLATSGGKNVLLVVILYPLTTPVLLFALVATRALLDDHPGFSTYLGQMLALDVVLAVVGAWLFEPVLVGTGRAPAASPAPRSAPRSGS